MLLVFLGVILFFLGLLMLIQEQTAVGLFLPIFGSQALELVGVLFQAVGGLLVLYGAINAFTSEFVAKNNREHKENQAFLMSLMQSVDRVEKRTAEFGDKLAELGKSISSQGSHATLKCKFCGAMIDQGSTFCPNCGKSQA